MASKATRRAVEEEDLANVEFETSEDVEVFFNIFCFRRGRGSNHRNTVGIEL